MKGRWFFWIPVILYSIYYLVSIIDFKSEAVIGALIVYTGATILISIIYYFGAVHGDRYYNFIEQIKDKPVLCIFIPELYIIFGINYIFDKYLTIK